MIAYLGSDAIVNAGSGVVLLSADNRSTYQTRATAFADVVSAEDNVRLATEQKALAEDVLKSVSIRVGAAAAALVQKSRAEVERSTATIALDKASRERDITRKRLAALMGEESFTLPLDTTGFYAIREQKLADNEKKLKNNPDPCKAGKRFGAIASPT